MGLFDKLMGEFVDVIQWTDDSSDTMVYRFERYGNEIKYGAKLTVRESQAAVFVNEGQIADVFSPGLHELTTQNLPILTTLKSWPHGFQSPFKAEVYFCSMRRFVDLKWGTLNPIMLRDQEFGPVRLRAFGTYTIRIADPARFIKEIAGTDGHFTTGEISDQLRNIIVSRFGAIIGQAHIPVLDLAADYDRLGTFLLEKIASEFTEYGLELGKLLVENISLPPAVEEALDKRTSMGVVGDMDRFLKYQAAESFDNPGGSGSAGEAMGMGMGFAMAQQMAQGLNAQKAQPSGPTPPPLPAEKSFHLALGGKAQGPFPLADIRARVASGEVGRDTLAWTEGMAAWAKAGEVPELDALFAAVPPPLPPV